MNTDFRTKQIYRLRLDDYSAASFTSFDKDYFGTLEDIQSFISAIRNDPDECKRQEELLLAFEKYLDGNHTVLYGAAYSEEPLLVRAKRLSAGTSELQNFQWEHINTWQCPYFMKCDSAKSEHLWLSYRGEYARCIRTRFKNLRYGARETDAKSLNGGFWGFPHQIEEEQDEVFNRLFVIEKIFSSKSELLQDAEQFKVKPVPEFSGIMNDIFGDG